jgi:hypothetical protein
LVRCPRSAFSGHDHLKSARLLLSQRAYSPPQHRTEAALPPRGQPPNQPTKTNRTQHSAASTTGRSSNKNQTEAALHASTTSESTHQNHRAAMRRAWCYAATNSVTSASTGPHTNASTVGARSASLPREITIPIGSSIVRTFCFFAMVRSRSFARSGAAGHSLYMTRCLLSHGMIARHLPS